MLFIRKFLIMLALGLALMGGILVYGLTQVIADNKSWLEDTLSARLHTQVEIGELQLHWRLDGVGFVLSNVRMSGAALHRQTIELREVELGMALFASLEALEPKIGSLAVRGARGTLELPPARLADVLGRMTPGQPLASRGEPLPDELIALISSLRTLSVNDASLVLGGEALPPGAAPVVLDVTFSARRLFRTFKLIGSICPHGESAPTKCHLSINGALRMEAPRTVDGSLQVTVRDLPLPRTPWLYGPLFVDSATGQVSFTVTPQRFAIAIEQFRYRDQDLELQGRAAFSQGTPPGGELLDVDLGIVRANVSAAINYIPVATVPPPVMAWLRSGLHGGYLSSGSIRIKGHLADIPRHDGGDNLFSIVLGVKNAELQFDPRWPAVSNLAATIRIGPDRLGVSIDAGRSGAVEMRKASTVAIDFHDPQQRLHLLLHLAADSAAAQTYLRRSPLATALEGWAGKVVFSHTPFTLKLALGLAAADQKIPLMGALLLDGASFAYKGGAQALGGISGTVDFTEDSLKGHEISARYGGMPLIISMGIDSFAHSEPFKANISGTFHSRDATALMPEALAGLVQGSTPFRASVVVTSERSGVCSSIRLDSPLTGLALELPNVYHKPADRAAALQLIAAIDTQGRMVLDLDFDQAWKGHLSSGPDFDFLQGFSGYFLPRSTSASALARRGALVIDSPRIKGFMTREKAHGGRLLLDFSRVEIGEAAAMALPKTLPAPLPEGGALHPAIFAPLKFKIKELRYNGARIDDLEGLFSGTSAALLMNAVTLTIDRSRFSIHEAALTQTGSGVNTRLKGELHSANLGKLMSSLGMFADLRGLAGTMNFSLAWPGYTWLDTKQAMVGSIDLDLAAGSIQGGNSIPTRILNLITLNLPQTLHKDLEINTIKGRLVLDKGLMTTDKFNINMPGAAIETKGQLNLIDETIDSRVAITLDITRLLKIGLTFAINPILGGLYWWKANPEEIAMVDRLTRHSYQVTGPWKEPQVKILPIIKIP